jgi:hypothetical protein
LQKLLRPEAAILPTVTRSGEKMPSQEQQDCLTTIK